MTFQGPAELLQLPLALSPEEHLFSQFSREPSDLQSHSLISETACLSAWEEPQGSHWYRPAGISCEGRAPGIALPWPGPHKPFQTEESPVSDQAGVEHHSQFFPSSELPAMGRALQVTLRRMESCLRQPEGGPCLGSISLTGVCASHGPQGPSS